MLAATLLSAFVKFRPVILTTNLCVCVHTYIWHLKCFPNKTVQEVIIFPMCKIINGSLLF